MWRAALGALCLCSAAQETALGAKQRVEALRHLLQAGGAQIHQTNFVDIPRLEVHHSVEHDPDAKLLWEREYARGNWRERDALWRKRRH